MSLIDDALDGKTDALRKAEADYRVMGPHAHQNEIVKFEHDTLRHAPVYAWEDAMLRAVKASTRTLPSDIPFSPAWLYTQSGFWWLGRNSRLMVRSNYRVMPPGTNLESAHRQRRPKVGEGEDCVMRLPVCAITFGPMLGMPDSVFLQALTFEHLEPTKGPVPAWTGVLTGGKTIEQMFMEALEASEQKVGGVSDAELGRMRDEVNQAVRDRDHARLDKAREDMEGAGRKLHWAHDRAKQMERHAQLLSKQGFLLATDAYTWSLFKVTKFFLAAGLWLQQRILTYSPGIPSRHPRKRAAALAYDPKVYVVELRRRDYQRGAETPGGLSGREYTCQWIVRGHWRSQYYPSKGIHIPIWLIPQRRGPKDMPLKQPKPEVFAVRR